MVFSLALGVMGGPPSVSVPLVRPVGSWSAGPGWGHTGLVVRVDSAGGPRRFRISPQSPMSVPFSSGKGFALAGHPVEVTEVRTPPQRSALFPADGLLGADWMRDKTLGFDPDTSTLHVWTKGLTEAEALAWVGEGAASVPVLPLPDGRFAQSVTLDGETRLLVLASAELPPTVAAPSAKAVEVGELPVFGVATGHKGPGRASLGASAGGRRLEWLMYGTGTVAGAADGFLPIFEGTSGRVVLDLPGGRLVSRPATLDERIAEELFRVVQIPVRARNGEIVIDGTAMERSPEFRSLVGKPVIGIGGVYFSSVMEDWRSGDRPKVFAALAQWRREGCELAVLRDAAKNETVGIPVSPDPWLKGH